MYWNSVPRHRRKPFTEDTRYDRFIVNLPGFEPEQIEEDDLDPIRPRIVRGMYFEELRELVMSDLMRYEEEKAQAARATGVTTTAAAETASVVSIPGVAGSGAKAGPSSGQVPGLANPSGPVRYN